MVTIHGMSNAVTYKYTGKARRKVALKRLGEMRQTLFFVTDTWLRCGRPSSGAEFQELNTLENRVHAEEYYLDLPYSKFHTVIYE